MSNATFYIRFMGVNPCPAIMKYVLSALLTCCSIAVYSQSNTVGLSLEYTPNFSKLTNHFPANGFTFSHQFFGRVEFNLTPKLGVSVGLGYLNTRDTRTSAFDGQLGIERIELLTNHDYVVLPVGVRYHFGTWFIRPEVGVGINFAEPGRLQKQTSYLINGERQVDRWDNFNQREYNDVTFPLSLSIVKEIRLQKYLFLLGVKGFYSLERVILDTPIDKHYIGFGLLTGARF